MKNYFRLVFYFLLQISNSVFPQTSLIQWQKSVGAEGDDIAYSIIETKDGGYISGDTSNSHNASYNGNHGDRGDCSETKNDRFR